MPFLPHLPVRTLVSKAADVQVSVASVAFRLVGQGAGQLRRSGLPRAVGTVLGAGVGGVTTVAGALVHRERPAAGAPAQNGAAAQNDSAPTAWPTGTTAAAQVGTPAAAPPTTRPSTTARTGKPAKSAARPEAVAAGAPGTATPEADAAEQEAVEHGVVLEVVAHDDLPIPSYDEKTVGSLRPRLQRLDIDELVVLRAYEQAHAHRLQVLTMIENRIAKLRKQQAAASDADAGSS